MRFFNVGFFWHDGGLTEEEEEEEEQRLYARYRYWWAIEDAQKRIRDEDNDLLDLITMLVTIGTFNVAHQVS